MIKRRAIPIKFTYHTGRVQFHYRIHYTYTHAPFNLAWRNVIVTL